MSDEEAALVRWVGVNVIDVRPREGLGESLLMLPAVPFAANPANLGQMTGLLE